MPTRIRAFNSILHNVSKKRLPEGKPYGIKRTPLKPMSKSQKEKIKNYCDIAFGDKGRKCFLCNRTESQTRLVVHHFDKNRNNNKPDNLFPLCDRNFGCHAHNHMGNEGLAELNAKIEAKLKKFGNIHEQEEQKDNK